MLEILLFTTVLGTATLKLEIFVGNDNDHSTTFVTLLDKTSAKWIIEWYEGKQA